MSVEEYELLRQRVYVLEALADVANLRYWSLLYELRLLQHWIGRQFGFTA